MAEFNNRSPQLSNFSEYHLSAQVAAGDTVIHLASVAGLPTIVAPLDYIPMVLRDATTYREVVHVTSVDAAENTVTVLRAQEGTAAHAWPTSSFIYVTPTAETMRDLLANTWRRPKGVAGSTLVPTRVDDTSFTLAGDQTGLFVNNCALRIVAGGTQLAGSAYVTSSAYDGLTGLTTVVITGITIAATPALDIVEVSQRPDEVPKHIFVPDQAALLDALDMVVGVDVQAHGAKLDALSGLTASANTFPYFTGANSVAAAPITSFARSLLDDADPLTARTTLGVVPGTNVQPYSANLASIASNITSLMQTLLSQSSKAGAKSVLGISDAAAVAQATESIAGILQLAGFNDVSGYFGNASKAITPATLQYAFMENSSTHNDSYGWLCIPGQIRLNWGRLNTGPSNLQYVSFYQQYNYCIPIVVLTPTGSLSSMGAATVSTGGFYASASNNANQDVPYSSFSYLAIGKV